MSDQNGHYILENIPPRTYKLKLWHEGVATASKEEENGKVKKHNHEYPYEITKDVTVPAHGSASQTMNSRLSTSYHL